MILALIAVLATLATLQYRWIAEVSDAAEQRMRANMEFAARHFSYDVDRELLHVVSSFDDLRSDTDDASIAAMRDEADRGGRIRLISDVFAVTKSEDDLLLQRLEGTGLTGVSWPPALSGVYERLIEASDPSAPRVIRDLAPVLTSAGALVLPVVMRSPLEQSPAGSPGPARRAIAAVVVQLNEQFFRVRLFPTLAHRYFATNIDDELDVVVVAGTRVVYRSDPGWPDAGRNADLRMPLALLSMPAAELAETGLLPQSTTDDGTWFLLVRRHGGTLADAVLAIRRRNLAISGVILGLLAGSILILAFLFRRAETLRQQQLHFVSSVTHELNTPLAALSVAGQNLSDGILTDEAQIARYGAMIVREAGRLRDMVSEILEFAGMQARKGPRVQGIVDIGAVIADAVAQTSFNAESAGVRIETEVCSDLAAAEGDAAALTRAVRNLIANGVRHGAIGGWVGVTARNDGPLIVITVEDHGPGIDHRDAAHLFEPFYRGRGSATVAGSGLGLTIVDHIARNHGGTVSVERRRERGAAFTLRIPARERADARERNGEPHDGSGNPAANPAR